MVFHVIFFHPSQDQFQEYDEQVGDEGVAFYGSTTNFYWRRYSKVVSNEKCGGVL